MKRTKSHLRRSRLLRQARTIHLIDIENLAGIALPTAVEVEMIREAYVAAVEVGPEDLTVIGSSHSAARVVWWSWPGARRLVRSGPNGAGLALLQSIEAERLADRCERVAIGSGNGIFAEACARLQAAGCEVTVACRDESLSRALRFAVRDVRIIETLPEAAPYPQALRAA
jgi:hypothetical protein